MHGNDDGHSVRITKGKFQYEQCCTCKFVGIKSIGYKYAT